MELKQTTPICFGGLAKKEHNVLSSSCLSFFAKPKSVRFIFLRSLTNFNLKKASSISASFLSCQPDYGKTSAAEHEAFTF
jgi:hypothetical protein